MQDGSFIYSRMSPTSNKTQENEGQCTLT